MSQVRPHAIPAPHGWALADPRALICPYPLPGVLGLSRPDLVWSQSLFSSRWLCNASIDTRTRRWAVEGLAYLTLDADVKDDFVQDIPALQAMFELAKVHAPLISGQRMKKQGVSHGTWETGSHPGWLCPLLPMLNHT